MAQQVQDPAARRKQNDRVLAEEERRFKCLIVERDTALQESNEAAEQIQTLNKDLQSARELAQQAKSRYQLSLEAISQQTARMNRIKGEIESNAAMQSGTLTSFVR
jgi:uncharacterized coiled-coil DUF342 family protein